MIYMVQGTPGSGKTYYAMRKIVDAITNGKTVVTNVALCEDWAERVARMHPCRRFSRRLVARKAASYRDRLLYVDDMRDLLRVRVAGAGEGRAVAVLDEVQTFLNSRSWNDKERKSLVEWCQRHRHYGFDVYLIAQLASTVDKSVRELYEEAVKLKNLRNFKLCGLRIFPRPRFVAIHTWNTRESHVLKRESYGLNRRVAGLYDTHQYAAALDEPGVLVMPRSLDPAGRYSERVVGADDGVPDCDLATGCSAATCTEALGHAASLRSPDPVSVPTATDVLAPSGTGSPQ